MESDSRSCFETGKEKLKMKKKKKKTIVSQVVRICVQRSRAQTSRTAIKEKLWSYTICALNVGTGFFQGRPEKLGFPNRDRQFVLQREKKL